MPFRSKILIGLIVIIDVIAPIWSYSVDQTSSTISETIKTDCADVCLTPGCIHAASHALERMDMSVDPCDDFYSFACGNFVKEASIPDDKNSIDIFSTIQDKVNGQLRSLISENINPNDPLPFNMAKTLYKTCLNESMLEANGLKPLQTILDKLGGWPVVKGDQWNENADWNWTWTVEEFRKIGYSVDYIFGFAVDGDLKNSMSRKIYVN